MMQLARVSGGIKPLLESVFGFLHKHTDFYIVDPSETRKMGFALGQAERLVTESFRRYPLKDPAGVPKAHPSIDAVYNAKPAVKRATNRAATSQPKKSQVNAADASASSSKAAASAAASATSGAPAAATTPPPKARPAQTVMPFGSPQRAVRRTKQGKQVPVGNGGASELYTWTQTLNDLTVNIPLPGWARAKDLNVQLAPSSLRVTIEDGKAADAARKLLQESGYKGRAGDAAGSPLVLIEGKTDLQIRPGESGWSLERDDLSVDASAAGTASGGAGRATLGIVLDKVVETWWERVVVAPKEAAAGATAAGADAAAASDVIDTSMVDSTKPVEDFDPETQAAIRKLVFEQRQKDAAGGLPEDMMAAGDGAGDV
jgi:hypothetical protein